MKSELVMLRDRVRKETSLPVLALHADTAFRHVKYAKKSDCKFGCSYCCRTNIHPTLPELARILQEIETWGDEQKAQLKSRVAQVAEFQKDLSILRADKAGSCVMLNVDGTCSIYRARPLVCRGMNSTSVDRCRRSKPVMDSKQMTTAMDGRDALGDVGYKLPLALDIILNKQSNDLSPAQVTF